MEVDEAGLTHPVRLATTGVFFGGGVTLVESVGRASV
jgi:hypothetical protein